MAKRLVFIGIAIIVLAFSLYTITRPHPYTPDPNATYVTLLGYTETTGRHIGTVDIKDVPSGHWPARTVVTVPEGTRVELVSHTSDDALVVAPNGIRGYVSTIFVRELCGNDCP